MQHYRSIRQFYPFYLTQHQNRACRRLHVVGTLFGVSSALFFISTGQYLWLPLSLVGSYGCAWIGHFFFEKNKPAAFGYPGYSFVCDFLMLFDWLVGRLPR